MGSRIFKVVEATEMKLSDISNGADWIVWAAFAVLAVLSIILISGHGSSLISGYNTASEEEKAKYDEKKLCRTMGMGMAVIAVLILIMGLFEDVLPADFAYIALGIMIIDCAGMVMIGKVYCRK